MKINSKILSIPPYISTSWDNVASLQMDDKTGNLVIVLKNSTQVSVPNLTGSTLEDIFNSHKEFLEASSYQADEKGFNLFNLAAMPGTGMVLENLPNLSNLMQHDGSKKNEPDLPKDLLDKIQSFAKALGLDKEAFSIKESEPHCNCHYCQVGRALHQTSLEETKPDVDNSLEGEDPVSEQDLHFREWDIEKVGEGLYNVTNPLDKEEHYQVFLKNPIGCTCGKTNCDHIVAVLNS